MRSKKVAFYPGLISISDEQLDSFFIYRRLGGQPSLIVPTLARALSLGRRGVTAGNFTARVCAAIGGSSIRETMIFSEEPSFPIRYLYRIRLIRPQLLIYVEEISDAGVPTTLYPEGIFDGYLTRELRRKRVRRGRAPAGYDGNKDEANRDRINPTLHDRIEILNERAQAENPHINLKGVRVISKDEYFAAKRKKK